MLKENYSDDVFEGKRKYQITDNSDGTKSIDDVTSYTSEGDLFGANDINVTNKAINRSNSKKSITLTSSGWSSSAPYTQTVSVSGMTAEDLPIPLLDVSSASNESAEKQLRKQFAWLSYYDTAAGQITFTAKYKKPTVNLTIDLKGVN